MAAVAKHREPSSQDNYRALLANFEAAYKCMQECSKEFTRVLGEARSPLCLEAHKARTESARIAYDEAQQHCMEAVAKLQEHVLCASVSLRVPVKLNSPVSHTSDELVARRRQAKGA